MAKFTVTLQPAGRRIEVEPGTNLLEAAQRAGIEMVASCGGLGICSTCKVSIAQGRVTVPTETELEELGREQIAAGFRLACQTEPLEDVRVEIPRESLVAGQRIQMEGREGEFALDPAVKAFDLELSPPTLDDLRGDYFQGVDHRVAGDPDALYRNSFGQQIVPGPGSGGEVVIGQRPGQPAVQFFGVRLVFVPGAQTSLDMTHRDLQIISRQGGGKGGGGVAMHQYQVGLFPL